ncbi:MAG: hypothetical protein OXG91_10690 [bacterium]|nr:hypothetical protein [bacterium]
MAKTVAFCSANKGVADRHSCHESGHDGRHSEEPRRLLAEVSNPVKLGSFERRPRERCVRLDSRDPREALHGADGIPLRRAP